MGFPRPSKRELVDRAIGDISSRTQGSAYIKRSVERVLATNQATIADGVHGHLEWNQRQQLPTTSDIEGLLGWGVWLKVDRKGAVKSSGVAYFTGCTPGTNPAVGTQLQTVDGVAFETTEQIATSAGGIWSVKVRALVAGANGNLDYGTPVSPVSPVAGIDSSGGTMRATLPAVGSTGGSDIEDVEDYRLRILNALRLPPAGGGSGDYVAWALECEGVTRAWEFGNRMGYGTVSVAFVMDDRADIVPTVADVAVVQSYIDSVRPIDMRAVYVQAPIKVAVDMNLSVVPNTQAVKDAVLAELEYLFTRSADLGVTMPLSKVNEAISTAVGEEDHTINSIGSLVPGEWTLLTLGTVVFP